MTSIYKNGVSFLLGLAFINLFVWLSSVIAAAPVPEILSAYEAFVVSYYSNILIIISASFLSLLIMFVVRKVFSLFTKQNLFYFSLPIISFLVLLLVFLNFAMAPLFCAAIPTLMIAALLSKNEQQI